MAPMPEGRCQSCGAPHVARRAHWSDGWNRLTLYLQRWGAHDPDRPAADADVRAVVARAGGMGAFRRGEKNRWDFKQAWEAIK